MEEPSANKQFILKRLSFHDKNILQHEWYIWFWTSAC